MQLSCHGGADEDFHTTTDTAGQTERGRLLDDNPRGRVQPRVVDSTRGLKPKGDGFAIRSLDKNLHTTAEMRDWLSRSLSIMMDGQLTETEGEVLYILVREGAETLELLAGKGQTLLVGVEPRHVLAWHRRLLIAWDRRRVRCRRTQHSLWMHV